MVKSIWLFAEGLMQYVPLNKFKDDLSKYLRAASQKKLSLPVTANP
jgi:hypothetical protein